MNKKITQIVKKKEEKELIKKIARVLEGFDTSLTSIQIENFVLNDVEFPTEYGKFKQAQLELHSDFLQLADLYFDIKEKEIEIKKKEKALMRAKDKLDKELLKVQKEKLEFQLSSLRQQVKKILKEARVFYSYYERHPEWHKLSPKEAFKLEAEQWAKKTLNMPTVFEERYGKEYMTKVLGEENYKKYLELRRKSFGLLPREIFEIKQLEGKKEDNQGKIL